MDTAKSYDLAMQRKIANISATASSMRSQAPAGAIVLTIDYLEKIDLSRLSAIRSVESFNEWLNGHTRDIAENAFRCTNFGGPRKIVNIFLKEIFHNHALRKFIPGDVYSQLEIPLDKHVAAGLSQDLRAQNHARLPRWKGIKHLTPEVSETYQSAASQVAAREGVHRVDLDLKYWRMKP